MSVSEIEALGYVGLEVSDIAAWRAFAADLLGVEAMPRDDGTIDLRLDAYATRIRLHSGSLDDLAYAGWEVRDADALVSLERRLAAAGVGVERVDQAVAADRCVAELIRFVDPEGTTMEAFYGPLQRTDRPAVSPLGVQFKTGRQGLGHIVLACHDKPVMMEFYNRLLGFRISDHINSEVVRGRPLEITFMRCNSRHHSLALVPAPLRKRLAHLMIEVDDIDDVGRAMYRCLDAGVHLSMTLGRHSNDEMLSFYPMSPSGFDIEYGWGGLAVDDDSWHVLTHDRNSAWGHHFQRPPKPAAGGPRLGDGA
jgi:2,3-dihydroxybiphenyl 1,2-dioxygenase